ncbi:MAG TPA: ABC transporter ATP-binding protein [Candidatus Angelobacter sp.]|nr:ABC transporter ATP-binding protein [Candidatus Angelobacter sp.]
MTSGVSDPGSAGASPAQAARLRMRGVSVDYVSANGEDISALRDVNLEILPQHVLGVLGESGSGKSSLSRAILRLLPPNGKIVAGSVEYDGKDILRLSPSQLRELRGAGIALISQEPALALNPVLTIERQIIDVLRAHSRVSKQEAMARTRAMLSEVGFPDPERIVRAYPHQLSGGQRQRAAIAQALICQPGLLIADEPLSSLDTITQAEILDLLRKLKREFNLTVIFVTHNARVLSSLADKVVIMRQGGVRATGTLEQIGAEPDDYVRGLIYPEKTLGRGISRAAGNASSSTQPSSAQRSLAQPLVQISNVSKHFVQRRFLSRKKFAVQALKDVHLEIPQGSTVAVIGRSGSGKTTLARCIAGFEKPDSGRITFTGGGRRNVQLIFQDAGTALNPRFTAEEAIAEPLDIGRQGTPAYRRQRALQLMEESGLDPAWAGRKVGEFSGGQRQRLAIARALAAEPEMVILDESLSGLDLPLQAQILCLLMDLQSHHGLTYLHITHDLSFLPQFADRVVVMDQGAIVDACSPAALFASSHPATRALVEASESLHAPGLEAVL